MDERADDKLLKAHLELLDFMRRGIRLRYAFVEAAWTGGESN